MMQGFWLETCARRIRELDSTIESGEADDIAAKLLLGRWWPYEFRSMHPVAAAEAWHSELGSDWPVGAGAVAGRQGAARHH